MRSQRESRLPAKPARIRLRVISTRPLHFNDRHTTPFGPAYADIWTAQQNFLACRPPVARAFSYALCYFSGPAVGTPVLAGGGPTANPPLPCTLSADGNSATCTCYEINTEQYPPFVPYYANINGILNLDLYLRTIAACGHDGELCGAQAPLRDHMWWNAAPVCRAVNTNNVIPNAELFRYSRRSGIRSTSPVQPPTRQRAPPANMPGA